MKRRYLLLVFPVLVNLEGCTVGPDYKAPSFAGRDAVVRGRFIRASDSSFTGTPGLARWWESLNDATLTALIDDALAESPSIDAATARIRQARATLRAQGTNGLPTLSASASYLHAQLPGIGIPTGGAGQQAQGSSASGQTGGEAASTSLDFYNLGTTASWEPDVFGGGRRGIEQARAQLGNSFAALADAQVSLSAQVAQAYVSLRDVQARSALNQQSTTLQTRALALTMQRYLAGTATALDVERMQAQLNNTDAQNIPLAAQADQYLNELAVLTGREPGALDRTLTVVEPIPLPPAVVPIGDPGALIARRPDVRQAERTLAANTAAIGIQEAKRYPSVRFMGIFGLGGTQPGDVVDISKFSALLAPTINWSFLDFGQSLAKVRQARGARDEALAKYHQALLEALRDAETSLSRFGNTRQQLGQLVRAEESASRSVVLNAQRVTAGTSTAIDQLDIERQQLSAAIQLTQGRAQLTESYIAVQKALGLGWTNDPRY